MAAPLSGLLFNCLVSITNYNKLYFSIEFCNTPSFPFSGSDFDAKWQTKFLTNISRCGRREDLVDEDHGEADADEEAKQAGHVVLVHPEKVALVQHLHLDIAETVRSENDSRPCIFTAFKKGHSSFGIPNMEDF